jgi:uncharacterized protein YbbC (DUF1343 family)
MRLGLENLQLDKIKGRVAYVGSGASVDSSLRHGVFTIKKALPGRLVALWGPQHGFASNKQDNMVESADYFDEHLQLKVYSLYASTREPSDEMLAEVDTILIDLQDVGTRVYTYISTMVLILKRCHKRDIKIIILDRPNPVGGLLEGLLLDAAFSSFVGIHPIIMRHGITMGELAKMVVDELCLHVDLDVFAMIDYQRESLSDYSARFINPSPNLATVNSLFTFTGTVLFEGTTLSEGRGTTRSLELLGYPEIDPYELEERLNNFVAEYEVGDFILRPLFFTPMFQKHVGKLCGGFHIHVLNFNNFRGWRLGVLLLYFFYHELNLSVFWRPPPYEYEYHRLPIDLICGGDFIRTAIEAKRPGPIFAKEAVDVMAFKERISKYLIYN